MRFLFAFLLLSIRLCGSEFFDSGWDWEARKWQTNIAFSSGTLSSTSYNNGTIFMNQAKRWDIRPRLGRVNLVLGTDTNAFFCGIIRDFFNVSVGNDRVNEMVATNYAEATGLNTFGVALRYFAFNGAVSDMSVAAAAHTNIHLAVYARTSNNNNEYDMGSITAGVGEYSVIFSYGGTCYLRLGNDLTTSAALSSPLGFLLATRTATNFAACYHNTTQIVTRAVDTSGSTSGTVSCIGNAVNSGGAATAYSTKAYLYYAIGTGIPAGYVRPYQILVNGVQKRANRAVVP